MKSFNTHTICCFLHCVLGSLAVLFIALSTIAFSLRGESPLKCATARAQTSRSSGASDSSPMILIPDDGRVLEYGISPDELKRILTEFKQSTSLGIYRHETRRESKRIPAFYIDKYEVTNRQYQEFCKAKNHPPSRYAKWPQFNDNRQPVVGISWNDAQAYCKWAGKRLPTEEEWEKAARGSDRRLWPWGDERDNKRFNGRWLGRYASAPVGSFPSGDSPYGVSDMAGNVWEMTSGSWPTPDSPSGRTMRGGSYLNTLPEVRTTVRWATGLEEKGAEYLGFRCVKDDN